MSIQEDLKRNKVPIIIAGGAISAFLAILGVLTIVSVIVGPDIQTETESVESQTSEATQPENVDPVEAAEAQPEAAPEPELEEVTPEVKFSLFQSLVRDADPEGVIIVDVVSPAPGTAQIVVKENIWYLSSVDEQKELLMAWYQSWKNVYGNDARFELMAQTATGAYQIGGSKRDGEPSDLFLSTD